MASDNVYSLAEENGCTTKKMKFSGLLMLMLPIAGLC